MQITQWSESESGYFRGYETGISVWDASDLPPGEAIFVTELDSQNYLMETLLDRVRLTQLSDFFAPAGTRIDLIGFDEIHYRDFIQKIPNDEHIYSVTSLASLDYGAVFDGWAVGQFDSDEAMEIAFAGAHWPYDSIAYPLEILEVQTQTLNFELPSTSSPLNFLFTSVVSDLNSDGFDDVYLATTGDDFPPYPGDNDRIFFGSEYGLREFGSPFLNQTKTFSHWITSGDIDGDAALDILVGSVGGPSETAPFVATYKDNELEISQEGLPELLLNDFTLENNEWVIKSDNRSGIDHEFFLSGHLVDLDQDGYDDLIVGPDDAIPPLDFRPSIFMNRGNGEFLDNPLYLGDDGNRARGTLGIGSGDYDGDGLPEIWVSETRVDRFGLQGIVYFDDISTGFRKLGSASDEAFGFNFAANAEFPYEFTNVDVNGDDHLDIVSSFNGIQGQNAVSGGYVDNSPIILVNDGMGRFQHIDMSFFEMFGLQMIPVIGLTKLEPPKFVTVSYPTYSTGEGHHDGDPKATFGLLESELGIGTGPGGIHGHQLGVPGFNEQYYLNEYNGNINDYLSSGRSNGHIPYAPGTFVQGSDGIDTVWYERFDHASLTFDGRYGIFRNERTDKFDSIERIKFSDLNIATDLDGSAGQTAKSLAAVIGEGSLSNKEYVGIGLQLFDAGQSLAAVCELALTAVGATTNEDVVTTLYSNLYGEPPSDDQLQEYVELLNQGVFTKGSLAAAAAELTDDLGVIDLVGLAETGIEYV